MPQSLAFARPRAPQQPVWEPSTDIGGVVATLLSRPGLVSPGACRSLLRALSRVAAGEALVLQAGDCAERFADSSPDRVMEKAELLADLADLMEETTGVPVVRVGRFAGQYAKPRSSPVEEVADGPPIPVYRGDAVNSPERTARARLHDARRLVAAYDHTALALSRLVPKDVLLPATADASFSLTFTGHEALLLDYEEALVRPDRGDEVYGSSAHFLWVGERTRAADGAHIAFASRISNPVGVKVGPDADGPDITALIRLLAEGRPPGRLSLIIRMGKRVTEELPRLLSELGESANTVLWVCDPMHGNTRSNHYGQKTRLMSDILYEARGCASVLREYGLRLAGLHLETSPDSIMECVNTADDLRSRLERYTSACDPRLNADQAALVVRTAAEAGRHTPSAQGRRDE
ncbi:3-deoxy-7-phosphoheptulonate synthase [Nocardiopsis sp. M1B1]|uniref:3-deoxy-7-phosphoheptulonate synthase n=1 Tax=Nocardiopsis sp. M1B1 TaxID=3450454 RepID=UPI0040390803